MSTDFALADDPTRWGEPHGADGLDARASAFLHRMVGVPNPPKPEVAWGSLTLAPTRLEPTQLDALRAIVGAPGVRVDDDARRRHATGLSLQDLLARRRGEVVAPDAVVLPRRPEDVAQILTWCEANGVAVVPFGGGTSVVGGLRTATMSRASLVVSMIRMADIREVDETSHLVTVGAGITGPVLERQLAPRGLTLGHYPQSWHRATIGGYAATRSAGQASTGYGRSDDMVESLVVVTPRGSIRAGRVAASAAGPDLRAMFLGSEGAFGIITEVTLRVRSTPSTRAYTAVVFPDYASGLAAFAAMAQKQATADVMRLADPAETAVTMAMSGPSGRAGTALQRYLKMRGVTEAALAIFGWEGSKSAVIQRRLAGNSILRAHQGVSLGAAVGSAWLRHRFDGPFLRDHLLDAGYLVETLETATRWSHLESVRAEVTAALDASLTVAGRKPYVMSHVSHVYETGASLYFTVVAVQQDNPVEQWQRAKVAATQALLAHGATLTHHHGVGRDHAPWLEAELGATGVGILGAVKSHLDPAGVLNPGVLGLS